MPVKRPRVAMMLDMVDVISADKKLFLEEQVSASPRSNLTFIPLSVSL